MIGKLDSREEGGQSGVSGDPFALGGWSILALEGPDALTFAQSQLMNDLARLGDGQWQWSGWLNPKGRVITLCLALRRDAQTLWLLLPDMPASELAAALQRYVFRSKLRLQDAMDWRVAGQFVEGARPADAGTGVPIDDALVLQFGSAGDDGSRRRLLLLPATTTPAPDPDTEARWLACDLQAGLPHLDAGQRSQHTPQMLALDRLHAYSVKKGCYPGQEIVSRTHYLGKAKRRLCRLALPQGIEGRAGDSVADGEGRPLSTLLNVAITANGAEALAILDEDSVAFLDGQAARRLPLLDRLSRQGNLEPGSPSTPA